MTLDPQPLAQVKSGEVFCVPHTLAKRAMQNDMDCLVRHVLCLFVVFGLGVDLRLLHLLTSS